MTRMVVAVSFFYIFRLITTSPPFNGFLGTKLDLPTLIYYRFSLAFALADLSSAAYMTGRGMTTPPVRIYI